MGTKKWLLEAGLRYDQRSIFSTSNNDGRQYPDRSYNSVSTNAGATYRIKNDFLLTLSASSAWRAPNINELYSDGLHHGAARIEKGDSSLSPERANGIITGLSFNRNRWSVDIGIYTKLINDFIYLEPTYPPQLTIRGAFPSFKFSQTNARLSGTDISVAYEISHHISWAGKASILRAWNRKANDWLIQMPADRFENELGYTFRNGKFFKESYLKLNAQNVLKQNRIPADGPIEITKPDGSVIKASDYAPPPGAYMLFGFEAGTEISMGKHNFFLIIGVSNLFNKVYRDYMNAFRYYCDDMGRNISLRIKMPFELPKQGKQKINS
ncbi:MAG: TonB-dependent receptor [Bacteroidia bacterium]|nr:TonB-dependent receptor [Bacteroidia bacterium]